MDDESQATAISGEVLGQGQDVTAENVTITNGAANTVTAHTVTVQQGGINQVKAVDVSVEQGGIARAEANSIRVESGGIAIARAETITVSEGSIAIALAGRAEVCGPVAFLAAREVTGEARILFDLRAAVVAGLIFGLVVGIFKLIAGQRRT